MLLFKEKYVLYYFDHFFADWVSVPALDSSESLHIDREPLWKYFLHFLSIKTFFAVVFLAIFARSEIPETFEGQIGRNPTEKSDNPKNRDFLKKTKFFGKNRNFLDKKIRKFLKKKNRNFLGIYSFLWFRYRSWDLCETWLFITF